MTRFLWRILLVLVATAPFARAVDLNVTSNQTLPAGTYTYDNVVVTNGATLTLGANTSTGAGVTLNALNVTVASGATISANGVGYVTDQGTGHGTSGTGCCGGGGAGHGGAGGRGGASYPGGAAYGVAAQPTTLGSGGGSGYGTSGFDANAGGTGGGAIRLVVVGTLTIDGVVTANGNNGKVNTGGGGGAGGSIWLSADTFAGAGTVRANGGNGASTGAIGGGGAGGRIAIQYATRTFTGAVTALGGTGATAGSTGSAVEFQGTLLRCLCAVTQTLTLSDLAGVTGLEIDKGCNTTIAGAVSVVNHVSVGATVASVLTTPSITATNLAVSNGSTLNLAGDAALAQLTIDGGSVVWVTAASARALAVSGNATIATGSRLDVSGLGHARTAGPGPGTSNTGCCGAGGGGHGGTGGTGGPAYPGGAAYGSVAQPTTAGSGGGNGYGPSGFDAASGGSGGGALKLAVGGTLTVDGSILSNGSNAKTSTGGGGGAGGSIWLVSSTFAGTGAVRANGGTGVTSGAIGGGGAGGRISIAYATRTYTGAISATGGTGANTGGSGSIVESANGAFLCTWPVTASVSGTELAGYSSLVVDKGCALTLTAPAPTFSGSVSVGATQASTLTIGAGLTAGAFTIATGSTVNLLGALSLASLSITGASVLNGFTSASNTSLPIDVTGDVLVGAGSRLDANSRGFTSNGGPGRGTSAGGCCGAGGGGYGGAGGRGGSASYPGGVANGSASQPTGVGSAGGDGYGPSGADPTDGGTGGGAIKLTAGGTTTIDGTVTANGGGPKVNTGGGAGSGGGIWITTGILAGTGGSITANGANANASGVRGGGGGGGRIALYCGQKTFTGTVSVAGGTGANPGSTGTINELRQGTYVSAVQDFVDPAQTFGSVSWVATTPVNTSIGIELRAGSSATPDGTWTAWAPFANGASLATFDGRRFVQYRVSMSAAVGATSPTLQSLTIGVPDGYNTNGSFAVVTTDANHHVASASSTITALGLNAVVPAASSIKLLVSFDGRATWSTWVGSWQAVPSLATIDTWGMSPTTFHDALVGHVFAAGQTLDVAFALHTNSASATPELSELTIDYAY